MKKALSLFLSVVLTLGIFCSMPFKITGNAASSGTCGDNLTWTLDVEGTLTISGTGAMTNYDSRFPQAPWYSSRTEINLVVIESGVTSIGDWTFYNCTNLVSITIPDSVTSIGDCAFYNCTSFTSLTMSDSVTSIGDWAFYNCASLRTLKISDRATSIGEFAFNGCTSLTSITIPGSVTSIGEEAFRYCTSLTSINVDMANTNYSSNSGVLFDKNKKELIQYPIGKQSTNYRIPNSVTRVYSYAFYNCTRLTSVTIPNSVTRIGNKAFYNCSNLISVTIPGSVTNIGYEAFGDCTSLTAINVDVANIDYSSNSGVLFNKNKKELIQYPIGKQDTTYAIPDSVTSIGEWAFYKCTNLVSITIPDSVATIDSYAFYWCTRLTSVIIPNNVANISSYTFYNCRGLKSITIPTSITSIGNNAFYNCRSINDVYYSGTNTNWSVIDIDSSNSNLTSANIHYTVTAEEATTHYRSSVTENPTCTETGINTYNCPCGYSYTKNVDALGHNYSSSWTIDTVSTCTTKGSKSHHCTRCDAKTDVTSIAIDRSNHNYSSSWTIDTVSTCTTKGSKSRHCTRCNAKTDVTSIAIDSSNHNFSNYWTIDVPSTCQSEGSKSHHCTRCDKKTDVTVVKPVPHQFSDWKIIKQATYDSMGQKVSSCDVCKTTEYAVIPILKCAAPKLKKVTNTASGVQITWGKVNHAESYVILRKTGSGGWKQIAKNVKTTAYTDKTAKSGKTYKYTVRAKSKGGLSSYNTKGLSIKRITTPVLKKVSSAKAGVTFKWGKVTGAEGYIVYRKTGNGSWLKLATVKGKTKVSYLDKSAKKGATYKYTVKAYSGKTYSAYNTKGLTIRDKY